MLKKEPLILEFGCIEIEAPWMSGMICWAELAFSKVNIKSTNGGWYD